MSARDALKAFDSSLRRLAPMFADTRPSNGAPKDNSRPRPRLSAKARASMVLQGRYMGYMRQLKARQKARVRKIRETKGVRAAISTARQAARSM
jgi:hypothetical protein